MSADRNQHSPTPPSPDRSARPTAAILAKATSTPIGVRAQAGGRPRRAIAARMVRRYRRLANIPVDTLVESRVTGRAGVVQHHVGNETFVLWAGAHQPAEVRSDLLVVVERREVA